MPLDLATISEAELKQLSPTELQVLLWFARWKATARPKQIPPAYDANGIEVDEIGVLSGRGFGKLCRIDTPIPTPFGWYKIGELQVSDVVFDEK